MKAKMNYALAALCVAALAISCQKNLSISAPEEDTPNLVTLTCAFPALDNGTKVTLGTNGKTEWEADVDAIVFQGQPKKTGESAVAPVVHTFTAAELANPEVASFSVDISGLNDDEGMNHKINVAYPADIWSPYSSSHMYGRSSFSNTNKMLMAGYVDEDRIQLFHMTAAITFQVAGSEGDYDSYVFKGNNGEVVGYSKLVVEVNKPKVTSYRKKYKTDATYGSSGPLTSVSGSVISNGTAVNTVFLPVNTKDDAEGIDNADGANMVYLPNGFTIQLLKGGVIKKYITSTRGLTLTPGHMINLGLLPAGSMHDYVAPTSRDNTIGVDVSAATDLSATATANCYIVDGSTVAPNAQFKFKAAKGKGGAVVSSFNADDDDDVVVLWETKNTATAPEKGDIIAAVDYDIQDGEDAYIVFKMPATITPGNALIAAKNADGDIVWSWHIWVPEDTVSDADYSSFIGGKMMNMNLGALKAVPNTGEAAIESLGLLYQWGRKDPFVGARSWAAYPSKAQVSGTAWTKTESQASMSDAIKNPTVYYTPTKDDAADWNTSSDATLWNDGGAKGLYDPCPPGYKVPIKSGSLWTKTDTGWNFDTANHVSEYTSESVRFPMAGYIEAYGGSLYGTGVNSSSAHKDATFIWSATDHGSNTTRAECVVIRVDKSPVFYYSDRGKANAGSVRCVAE